MTADQRPRVVPEDATGRVTVVGEFRHLCPHVDEIDYGTIEVSWTCAGSSLELHSLGEYLASFADEGISHEALTEAIRTDLRGLYGIADVEVITRWETAGMSVRVEAQVLYLATPSTPRIRQVMAEGRLGCMTTPVQGNVVPAGSLWAADNGAFGNGYPGDDAWIEWLASRPWPRERCLFATAPDVVGDAVGTLLRSEPWLPEIRRLGYPAALVAQDGLEDQFVPWDELDCLFIGGTTEWKIGAAAADLANQALAHGKWVHMGRVNSWRRWQVAAAFGCDSVDGTFLAFGPDRNLPELLGWTAQRDLFSA